MVDLPPDQVEMLQQQAEHFAEQDLLALIDRAGTHFERIHRSTQPRILLEAARGGVLPLRVPGAAGGSGAAPGGPRRRGAPRRRAAVGAPRPAAAPKPPAAPDRLRPAEPDRLGRRRSCGGQGRAHGGRAATVRQLDPGDRRAHAAVPRAWPPVCMEGLPSVDKDAGLSDGRLRRGQAFPGSRPSAPNCPAIDRDRRGRFAGPPAAPGRSGPRARGPGPQRARRRSARRWRPPHGEELNEACASDPALDSLVDLMGGEPLPETERENWKPGD